MASIHLPKAWAAQKGYDEALAEVSDHLHDVVDPGTRLPSWATTIASGRRGWLPRAAAGRGDAIRRGGSRATSVAAVAEKWKLVLPAFPVCSDMHKISFRTRQDDPYLILSSAFTEHLGCIESPPGISWKSDR